MGRGFSILWMEQITRNIISEKDIHFYDSSDAHKKCPYLKECYEETHVFGRHKLSFPNAK